MARHCSGLGGFVQHTMANKRHHLRDARKPMFQGTIPSRDGNV
jgi:hypothetical protein